MDHLSEVYDCLIVTAIPQEWHAVCRRLENAHDPPDRLLPSKGGEIGSFRVLCIMASVGQENAASSVQRAADKCLASCILFVGIAGGMSQKEIRRGDVVFAKFVYGFDFGKLTAGQFIRRPDLDFSCDRGLLSYAEIVAAEQADGWSRRIVQPFPDTGLSYTPRAISGYIGSSGKVVDDPEQCLFEAVRQKIDELHAVEMEGSGVGATIRLIQAERQVSFLMIRGISDLVQGGQSASHGSLQRSMWKEYAADTASAFAEELLKRLRPNKIAGAKSDATKDGGVNLLTSDAEHQRPVTASPQVSKLSPHKILATKVQEMWIENVLAPTLLEAEGIKITASKAVIYREGSERANEMPYRDLFRDHGPRVLITGAPGAGKTIELLKFVEALMPRGPDIDMGAVPVVFNIATWVTRPSRPAHEQQSIREWFDAQFRVLYGLTKPLSKELIEEPQRVIYCLDGYDEIGVTDPKEAESETQAKLRTVFLERLQRFIEKEEGQYAKGFLLCLQSKREKETLALTNLRRPFTEIRIASLAKQDVLDLLESKKLILLRKLIDSYPKVLHWLQNPLQLHMLATVHASGQSGPQRDRWLVEAKKSLPKFVELTYDEYFNMKLHAFRNFGRFSHFHTASRLSSKELLYFTTKIACYLQNQGFQTFRLDHLQPSELPERLRPIYRWINALVFLVAIFLLSGIPVGVAVASEHWFKHSISHSRSIVFGLGAACGVGVIGGGFVALGYRYSRGARLGALIGLGFAVGRMITEYLAAVVPDSSTGLTGALRQGAQSLWMIPLFAWVLHHVQEDPMQIVPVEEWETDFRKATLGAGFAGLLGILIGLGPGVQQRIQFTVPRGVSFGVSLALAVGARFGKQVRKIPIQVRPNQAIEFSRKEAVRHAFWITLISVAIYFATYSHYYGIYQGLNNAMLSLSYLMTFFFFGGIPTLKHFALRLTLWKAKILPLRAISFLITAAQKGLMRQVGGGFQFSHMRVRGYFANKDREESWGRVDCRQK